MPINISPTTILFIIAYSFDLNWNYLEKDIEREDISDFSFFELLTFVLIRWTEKLVKEVLYKSFIDNTEQIKKVRGKILFNDLVKSGWIKPNQLYCQFDDLSFDTLENRIILSTFQYCRQELNKKREGLTAKRKETREQLNLSIFKLIRLLSSYVSEVKISSGLFNQLLFHRMNIKYKSILSLCRYIYYSAALKEAGEEDFLKPPEKRMSEVFEGFLRNYLAEQLYKEGFKVDKRRIQDWIILEESEGRSFFPDVVPDIVIWKKGIPYLIIDAKYYKEPLYKVNQFYSSSEYDKEKYKVHSNNLYQLITYSHVFNCDGLLIYAQAESGFFKGIGRLKPKYYPNSEISKRRYGFYTLDLSGKLEEFKNRLNNFTSMILEFMHDHVSDQSASEGT